MHYGIYILENNTYNDIHTRAITHTSTRAHKHAHTHTYTHTRARAHAHTLPCTNSLTYLHAKKNSDEVSVFICPPRSGFYLQFIAINATLGK